MAVNRDIPSEIIKNIARTTCICNVVLPAYHMGYTKEVIVYCNGKIHEGVHGCLDPRMRGRIEDPECRIISHRRIGMVKIGPYPYRSRTLVKPPF